MWKSVVWISLLLGYSYAGVASWSEDISVHNKHYSQHESSVNAARKAAADRLHQQQQAAALVASGSSTGPCDTLCYSSYAADGASDAETIGQGIVGFTSTGTGAAGSSQKYSASSSRMSESSVQNLPGAAAVYPAVASTSGIRSSYSSSSSSRQQKVHSAGVAQPAAAGAALYSVDHGRTSHANVVQPLVYTVQAPQSHASQSNYERSSNERLLVNRPVVGNVVYTPVPAAGSSSNSFNARSSFSSASNEQAVVQPVVYPTANNDYSRRYVASSQDHQYRQYPTTSNTYVLYSKPITSSVQYYAPSRSRTEETGSSTSYDSSGRVVNLNVVQPVHSERVDEQRTQQRAESVQTVQRQPDLYPVRSSYDHQEKEEQHYEDEVDGYTTDRTVNLLSPTVPSASSSSSSSQRRAEQQSSYVRTGSYVPNTGSSTRYSAAQSADSLRRQTYQPAPTYVAAVPVAGVASSSKYESASEAQQRHTQSTLNPVPVVVQPVPIAGGSSSSSRYASSTQEHRAGATGPGYGYVPAGAATSYGSQYSNTASSHNSRYKAGGSNGGFVHYPITNDEFGRRFGAVGGAGGYGAETDLHDIMSESETLARLQAQNVHNGAVTGSGTIDTDTRFGGESEGLGTMPGGFQRTKSWSSSSKWASEQRYGDDGKPKTYSMLSTAESEKHNINGKTTGYKAATTTLEDDGKVSTYSLHTT
uniref:Uncharacterized protein n=1 Tax=Anopheles maculatus TaxID=74869 RepID=A0A182T264_9DIPT